MSEEEEALDQWEKSVDKKLESLEEKTNAFIGALARDVEKIMGKLETINDNILTHHKQMKKRG